MQEAKTIKPPLKIRRQRTEERLDVVSGWIEAIELAEDKGKSELLVSRLRSTVPFTRQAREMLADFFDRRKLRPKPVISEGDIILLSAAAEFRELHPREQLQRARKQTGQTGSSIRDDYIKRIAKAYDVSSTALRNLLDGRGTAWKRLQKVLKEIS